MSFLLRIDVSRENSASRNVGNHFASAFSAANPEIAIRSKDFSTNPIPHLDGEAITAGYVPEGSRSESMQSKHQLRLDLIKEITEASSILITTPMWNWSTPSVLKAYIDQLIIPGVFDAYGNRKLAGKKVTIVIACGGGYGEGSQHPAWDHETSYLRHIFTVLGSDDVQLIRTEFCLAGIVPGMEGLIDAKGKSLAEAKAAAEIRARETN